MTALHAVQSNSLIGLAPSTTGYKHNHAPFSPNFHSASGIFLDLQPIVFLAVRTKLLTNPPPHSFSVQKTNSRDPSMPNLRTILIVLTLLFSAAISAQTPAKSHTPAASPAVSAAPAPTNKDIAS